MSTLDVLCILLVAVMRLTLTAPIPAASTISKTYDLARLLQSKAGEQLRTYLSYQGSPFSDPYFSTFQLQLNELPKALIKSYREWYLMSDETRLKENYKAYAVYVEYLQLVLDDQEELNPSQADLHKMLATTKANLQGLLSNLSSILSSMGFETPVVSDPLSSVSFSASAFEKKIRGYIVCKEYGLWMDRTVHDFIFLRSKYPA
nr:PREDICTED: cardiotrophin-2-like [Latimeria chalumnae]|eukprot:XP_006002257.2 PREDICTED: cardiotrophin-2-like [Latimeria chalumnae]